MKKGFTLIELLAVIIILGIIALIATPVVLNIIDDYKEEARKQSVTGYADAIRLSYVEEEINKTGIPLDELAASKLQGNKVSCNISKFDDKHGTILYGCGVIENEETKGNYCYLSGRVYEMDKAECTTVSNIIESGAIPYKKPNMELISQMPSDTEYAQSKEIKIKYPSLIVVEEFYFIKSNNSIRLNNIIGKCGNGNTPSSCEGNSDTLIEPNTWYQVSGDATFTVNSNIRIEAIIGTDEEFGEKLIYQEVNIDSTIPNTSIASISMKTDRAVVSATCSDTESGISKYEFSSDNGSTWINKGEISNHTFTGLVQNTSYNFKVRCTNGSGLTNEDEETKTTLTANNPVIAQLSQTPSSGTYASERVIRITYNGTGIENPSYYYSLDGNDWTSVSTTTKDVTFTSNGYLYAKTVDEAGNTANAATYTVTNIDTTIPSANITSISTKTDRAVVSATCSDTESGISKYEFSSNNGSTWVNKGTTSSHTFTGLTHGTSYTFKVRCTNGSGLTNEDEETKATLTANNPVIAQLSQTPSSGDYVRERVIRITYNGTGIENPSYYYSLDGNDWTSVSGTTKDVTFTSNGYLYAKTVDETGNTANASTYTVANIDSVAPTVSASVSGKVATFTMSDNIGIVGYGVNSSTTVEPTYTAITTTTSTTITWEASQAGDYVVWVKDVAGRVSNTSFSIASSAFCQYNPGTVIAQYNYTGGVQTFTAPCDGTYKLEVYGAQGNNSSSGGKGGYSYGEISLIQNNSIYIRVGSQAGYNGGGSGGWDQFGNQYYNGGGATYIAITNRGVLSDYNSYRGEVLIVAGGGGGSSYAGNSAAGYQSPSGGVGGGTTGGTGGSYSYSPNSGGTGGTQTSGSAFGQGGNATSNGGGGGGGYYGGKPGTGASAGGGGSGYIGGVTNGSTQSGQRSGNGYAKITLVSTN